jgi:hypothetical protein
MPGRLFGMTQLEQGSTFVTLQLLRVNGIVCYYKIQYSLAARYTMFLFVIILLRHVSATAVGHLQAARKVIDV